MLLLKFGMKEIKTLELSFILFGWGLSVKILLLLSGEGGWEFLILFVTTRPNEKQRKPCKYFIVDYI
jgi:hypothetical protein